MRGDANRAGGEEGRLEGFFRGRQEYMAAWGGGEEGRTFWGVGRGIGKLRMGMKDRLRLGWGGVDGSWVVGTGTWERRPKSLWSLFRR